MKTQYNALIELFDYRNDCFWSWLCEGPMVDADGEGVDMTSAEELIDHLDHCITLMVDYDESIYTPEEYQWLLDQEITFVELKYNQEFLSIVYIIIDSIYDRDKDFELFEGIEELMTIAKDKDKDKEPVAS